MATPPPLQAPHPPGTSCNSASRLPESTITTPLIDKTLKLMALLTLLVGCFWITAPFLRVLSWAAVIAISVRPAYVYLEQGIGYRPRAAAVLLTGSLLLALLAPLMLAGDIVASYVSAVDQLPKSITGLPLPPRPFWVDRIPILGHSLAAAWELSQRDIGSVLTRLEPWLNNVAHWFVTLGTAWGIATIEFIVGLILSGVLLSNCAHLTELCHRLSYRLAPDHGSTLLRIADETIRSVTIGVIGTALLQALLTALGLLLAGVPNVGLLGILSFVSATLQIGTALVWVPVACWLGVNDHLPWMLFIIAWGMCITVVDNFIKPLVMSQNSGMPGLLSFVGMTGGFITWGILGLFLGATLIAVSYRLLKVWLVPCSPEVPYDRLATLTHHAP